MRKLPSVKLCAALTMCCFVFFFNSFKSIYFGPNKVLVEAYPFDVLEEDLKELEAVAPDRKRVQAVNMSSLERTLNFTARNDVPTQTSWKAPIMWEGMFDGELYNKVHREANTSVAVTVFAIGRYLEAYLKDFMASAEKHLMVGLPVTYYIFTDTPEDVPDFILGPKHTVKILYAPRYNRWQDISMMRMKTISKLISAEISYRFPYILCLDVDSVFMGRFGPEALAESVTVLHPHFYNIRQDGFSYDRNPKSKAYMETGDYYYHAALFGGTWQNVKALVDFCYDGIVADKKNNVEALWHDESHLNKYFWLNKPAKVLSPEYSWDIISFKNRPEVRVSRMAWAKKRYDVVRT